MIYPSLTHAYNRHLLSLDLAHPRARVVTPLSFALRPPCVAFVSLCLPLVVLPSPLTIPPLPSATTTPTIRAHSPWGAMVAHSAMGHSFHLNHKTAPQNHHLPPHRPPDPGGHGLSNVPPSWGLSPPQHPMFPSTKGLRFTCPHHGLASHPLSLSPLEPQERRPT